MSNWGTKDIPSQRGRTAVVTGTGGIGFRDALALAKAGMDVIIAGRNERKGAEAVGAIRRDVPDARIDFEVVDLASLGSVRAFGSRMRARGKGLDLLINNAAIMAPPRRQVTEDGFELQFHTNYLGPFLLTSELLPLLKNAAGSRVVTVSSIGARNGKIDFDDLQCERAYRPQVCYFQSKLADLIFAFEFHRRSVAEGWGVASIAAHPGISRTDLIVNGQGLFSMAGFLRLSLGAVLFQSAEQGALPTLYAATSPEAAPGGYYGPDGRHEIRGFPAPAISPPLSLDEAAAERLWDISEELVGIRFGSQDERSTPHSGR